MTATLTPGSTICRPRFSTPRDESFPTHGPAVAAVAEKLGRPLMPWQKDAADVAYEYDPDTGLYRYDEVDITVPRQSGKSTLVLAKKVYRCTAAARMLGPQRATYTAQKRLNARRKLERDFSELLRSSRAFREITNAKARPQKATEWRLSLNNGSEAIQFGTGSFFQIDTPSRTGGHGDTLDDGTIDEAFAHEDDTVEAAMRPAMATRKNAQIWVISTAGDGKSKYLYRKVLGGRAASEAGQHGNVCYIEYSAPEDADPGDPATWWGCMPALGITITEEFIHGEWERAQRKGQEGIDMFLRAYLNLWPEIPILDEENSPGLDFERWKSLVGQATDRGTPVFGVSTAPDRSWAAVAVAWRRSDGLVQVQLSGEGNNVDYRQTTAWVKGRVNELRRKWGGRVLTDAESRDLVDDAEVVPLMRAEASLDDAITAGLIRHPNELALNVAVRGAKWRKSGDGRVLDRKGTLEISPVVAAALAVHGLSVAAPSVYETRDLISL